MPLQTKYRIQLLGVALHSEGDIFRMPTPTQVRSKSCTLHPVKPSFQHRRAP